MNWIDSAQCAQISPTHKPPVKDKSPEHRAFPRNHPPFIIEYTYIIKPRRIRRPATSLEIFLSSQIHSNPSQPQSSLRPFSQVHLSIRKQAKNKQKKQAKIFFFSSSSSFFSSQLVSRQHDQRRTETTRAQQHKHNNQTATKAAHFFAGVELFVHKRKPKKKDVVVATPSFAQAAHRAAVCTHD